MKKKIFLCTTVTSKDYKSWSNIPYLLHKNLEKRGFEVENVIFRELFPIKFLFNIPVRIAVKFFKVQTLYYFVRTPFHFFVTNLYSQYVRLVSKNEDVMIVQGFSYPMPNRKNKMFIIGDWPSAYLYEKFLKRTPSAFEMRSIERENKVIESANAVVTLFPDVHKYMLERYKNKNIYHYGNVVNIDEEIKISDDILNKKENSKKLLFIGKPFYIDGARELIAAVARLRSRGFDLEVDIIGIDSTLIEEKYNWLTLHGYLDKGIPSEKQKYYSLLENAKLFVNSTPKWNAFQATLEALHFYLPIVVRSNESLVQSFPNLDNISYLVGVKDNSLEEEIIKCIEFKEIYLEKCKHAHLAAKPYTWENFINKLVELIE
jgi:glycosyltransferase involved in cell wall biosynthesis